MAEEVGFGRVPKLDSEHNETARILKAAAEAAGDNVLTDWEEEFVTQAARGLKRWRNNWEITPARQRALDSIQKKLEKEGLL